MRIALVLLLASCGGVDAAPFRDVLSASSLLALGGAAVMTSIAGEGPPCVAMTPQCTAAPCAARVEVTIGADCPIALGGGEGSIILDGDWADADTGTFTPDLTQVVDVAGGGVGLSLGVVVLTRNDDTVQVVFAEQGASADDGAALDQEGWTVDVDLAGTPADPSDDVLDISGGAQRVDDGDVLQLAMAGVKTDAACRDNPVEGTATRSAVADEDSAATTLQFHDDCDGEVEVLVSTEAPLSIGDSVSLGL